MMGDQTARQVNSRNILAAPMVTCINLTFTQINPHKECNMAWDNHWSTSFVNMFKESGKRFSATIFVTVQAY